MKKFSPAWKGSKQKRKQRKYRYKAPLHTRHRFIAANLSKELRKRHNKRSLPVRKGDTIRVMRGEFKKKKGKISEVDLRNLRVYIEGMQRTKRDGTKVNVPFQVSNLQITEFSLADKKRAKALERAKKKEEMKKEKSKIKESAKEKALPKEKGEKKK